MTSPAATRIVRAARAIHARCLVLVGRRVRRAYRDDMIATFHAASEDAGRRGAFAVCRLLASELIDLARSRRAAVSPRLPLDTRARRDRGARLASIGHTAWIQAWRSLRRRPAFLAAAVLTLAAGTGLTTAAFALVDAVLIRPLPYPDADRLVTVYESSPSARERTSLVAPARLEDWNRLTRAFAALSGSYTENVTDTSAAEPERLEGRRVMPRFFTVFGTAPIAGRTFVAAEEQANGPGAAVVSERFWVRRFGRSPAALGHALLIGGRPYPIVGVMPIAFTSAATDVWLPAQIPPPLMQVREARFVGGVGRLRAGVTLDEAARDVALVQDALAREFPRTDAGWSAEIRSLKDARVGTARGGLVLVSGAVALLWVIAVANIAGLTVVQVHRRARELAIRAALGASRARVAGTVAREGCLVSAVGGAGGLLLAWWLTRALPSMLTRTPRIDELSLDGRSLAFAGATTIVAAGAFGLVPAVAGSRAGLAHAMSSARAVAGGRHRLQKALVVGQVALSIMLVGSATLLLRSYHGMTTARTGLDATNVVTFHVGARWDEDRTRVGQLQEQLLARLEELPHVQAAGMTNFLPATGATLRYQVRVEGVTGPNPDGSISVGARMIGGGYLPAVRASLIAGAWCAGPTTNPKAPRTAMVNRRLLDAHAPGQDIVGRTLRFTQGGPPMTIVGVVGDLAEDGLGASPFPYVYTCDPAGSWPDPEYVVRTSSPGALGADVRRIVREIDPGRAVFGMRALQDVLDGALDQPRVDAALLGAFAASAVALAAIGLHGLFMLVVAERAREMAVRLAIGAAPGQVARLVTSGAGRLLAGGIVTGVALTLVADRLLRGSLPGIAAFDAPAVAAAALVLTAASAAAVAVPAWRASRIEPLEALRAE